MLTVDSTVPYGASWQTPAAGAGGGAPANASYLVVGLNATLTAERNLVVSAPLLAVDAGANAAYTLSVAANGITDAFLRQGAAASVIGRSGGTLGNVADIAASSNGDVLRMAGGVLGFGSIPESSITGLGADLAALVPLTRAVNTTAPLTGGGTLAANLTLAISDFAPSGGGHARGAVPDPGAVAGTAKFLREDATWAPPPAATFATALVALTTPPALRDSGTTTISGLSGLTVGKRVQVWQDAALEGDAIELDRLQASGVVTSATTITVYWWAAQPVSGSRNLAYLVGG